MPGVAGGIGGSLSQELHDEQTTVYDKKYVNISHRPAAWDSSWPRLFYYQLIFSGVVPQYSRLVP